LKVVITTTTFGKYDEAPLILLRKRGMEVILNPYGRKLKEEETKELIAEADGMIAGTESLTASVLKAAGKLKVISRCGAGLDNVELKAAHELGISVSNTPDGPTKAVAELTLCLILNCLRTVPRADRDIRNGIWDKSMGSLLAGKVVGVIGYGRIGRAVSKLVRAFGAKVFAYDICPSLETDEAHMVSFERLIAESDIITLHLPIDKTKGYIISSEIITKMREGSYLINVSRGGLVDEEALYAALKSKKISGAAVDAFCKEPYTGKLKELDNIVLTPHVGSYARESRIAMEMQAVSNLLRVLEAES